MTYPRLREMPCMTGVSGPFATVYACKFCNTFERVPKGGSGRGYGLSATSSARSRLNDHIKEKHPEQYAAAMKRERERKTPQVDPAARRQFE